MVAQINFLTQALDENSEFLSSEELHDLIAAIFSRDWESSTVDHAVIESINLFVDQCFTTLIGLLSLISASEQMLAQSHSFVA